MGWFSIFPCFAKQRKLKKSVNPITSSSSVDQGNEKTCESVLIKIPTEESTNLVSIQNPLLESRDNCEDHLINDSDDKTDITDLDVQILPVEAKGKRNTEEVEKLGVLVQIENREEREKDEKKENELGNLVQIENEKESDKEEGKSSGVHVGTENAKEIKKEGNEEDEGKTEENKNGVQNRACSDSSISSYISYPPMHRYHNYVINEDEDHVNTQEDSSESLFSLSVNPRKQPKSYPVEEFEDKEVNSPLKTSHSPDLNSKSIWSDPNGSNLLNPVENLTQWKTLKKARPLSTSNHHQEKENINLEQEEETHEDRKVKVKNESTVTTSLSSWLVEPDKTPEVSNGDSQISIGNSCSYSDGVNSWKSYEDRPILGAWTIDEVRQVSARSSPRKSPCRDLDETPIIGSVGSYWNHTGQATDSSNSPMYRKSRRRIREKKASSCHSTPVKARLERAFEKDAA